MRPLPQPNNLSSMFFLVILLGQGRKGKVWSKHQNLKSPPTPLPFPLFIPAMFLQLHCSPPKILWIRHYLERQSTHEVKGTEFIPLRNNVWVSSTFPPLIKLFTSRSIFFSSDTWLWRRLHLAFIFGVSLVFSITLPWSNNTESFLRTFRAFVTRQGHAAKSSRLRRCFDKQP